jgi:hypothetical protein
LCYFADGGKTLLAEHHEAIRADPPAALDARRSYPFKATVRVWDTTTGKGLGVVASRVVRGGGLINSVGAHPAGCRVRFASPGRALVFPAYGMYWTTQYQGELTISEIVSETGPAKILPRPRGLPAGYNLQHVVSWNGNVLAVSGNSSISIWDLSRLALAARAPAPLSRKEFEALWTVWGGLDAWKTYQALRRLLQSPGQAVAFLNTKVGPVPHRDPRRIARLLSEIDDDDGELREQAEAELLRRGEEAAPALERALRGRPSAQVRRSASRILAALRRDPLRATGALQRVWAVELLERLGNRDARCLLQKLAGGEPKAWLTREARAALSRLERRAVHSR